ncbi:MAG: hydrogenase 2 operon protein HybA [Magnetospirillum sp.]|nr:hydrogenase 2 operon protein HybA [Magnetospirillum sp.]
MTISRRDFLKSAAAGTAAAAALPSVAEARGNLAMPPQALGLLFDSTLCVGCKICVTACKQANSIPFDTPVREPHLDVSVDIGAKALNVIKMYRDGDASVKDRETDGFAFTKKSCMHCVDPSCVSVCPVSAMQKDPLTGIVSHYKENCIGCRYCVASCPFGVPRFEYDNAFPAISKCQLCKHLQAEGKVPACADSCPTGATMFGPVALLKEEARRRLATPPGTEVRPDRRVVGSGDQGRPRLSAKYLQHIYGDKEMGGTQLLMLSGVAFEKLGMPVLPERSYASVSETIQHTLYSGMIAPVVALAGLTAVVARNKKKNGDGEQKP